jgi:hypothetical protein
VKIFQNLMRSIRRQPDVLGAWLRDHLDRIAPSDGSAEPRFEEANRLLDELDVWAWAIYNDESDPTLWRKALERWRAQSSNEAIAAAMARFGDGNWIFIAMEHLQVTKGKDHGLGLGLLHYQFVKLGLIAGPPVVTIESKILWTNN